MSATKFFAECLTSEIQDEIMERICEMRNDPEKSENLSKRLRSIGGRELFEFCEATLEAVLFDDHDLIKVWSENPDGKGYTFKVNLFKLFREIQPRISEALSHDAFMGLYDAIDYGNDVLDFLFTKDDPSGHWVFRTRSCVHA